MVFLSAPQSTRPLTHADRGRLGARKRWGAPRVVRLDELSPDEARLIKALADLARARRADTSQAA